MNQSAAHPTRIAFPVIGIGASAGGLESIESFFLSLRDNPGAAFVVIQHLSPDFKSYMPELLRKKTQLDVQTAEHRHPLKPNTIYLIPVGKNLTITDGMLVLSEIQPEQIPNKPIDLFFTSLANSGVETIIAIVLSGTGSDGAEGIAKVYAAGGRVFVESAVSAAFDGMPNAALATRAYTDSGTPEQIAELIFTAESLPEPVNETQQANQSRTVYNSIFSKIEAMYGVDFSEYKLNTIERRIDKRIFERQIPDLQAYWHYIQENPNEINAIYYDLLIGVTEFFRDKQAFSALSQQITLKVREKIETEEDFRVWIPGCASGEEAYSIAIAIDQVCIKENKKIDYKIFATDIDDHILNHAAAGIYSIEALAQLPKDLLEKYFVCDSEHCKIISDIRSKIVFAKHNVIADAPFTKLDLISCRNLLIYLDAAAQRRVLSLFYFSLLTGGLMFLGPSESLGKYQSGYQTLNRKWKLFVKTDQAPDYATAGPRTSTPSFPTVVHNRTQTQPFKPGTLAAEVESAHIALAESYLPPSLLIDNNLTIYHIYGELTEIMGIKSGKLSRNFRNYCNETLSSAVSVALLESKTKNEAVEYCNFKFEDEGVIKSLDFKIIPLRTRVEHEVTYYFLLVLGNLEKSPIAEEADGLKKDASELKKLALLEQELTITKQALQRNIEELATTNEELQSANEELMAANEELQSTNEELQSVNEELYSVNAEHQQKITELTRLSIDEENLQNSTNIGTIFLDKNYHIRKYTPAAATLFNLLPHDIGRAINDLTHRFIDLDLDHYVKKIDAANRAEQVEATDGRATYSVRFNAYLNEFKLFDGVVITLFDISSLKLA